MHRARGAPSSACLGARWFVGSGRAGSVGTGCGLVFPRFRGAPAVFAESSVCQGVIEIRMHGLGGGVS